MGEKEQPKRWRCLTSGCNPVLDEAAAAAHSTETGHRTAKWPKRSAAGKAKAKARNKSGYYDRYNVGAKSATARGFYNGGGGRVEQFDGRIGRDDYRDRHTANRDDEAMSEYEDGKHYR